MADSPTREGHNKKALTMEITKIHNVYENIHDYHAVHCSEHTGEVAIERAEYMALVTFNIDDGYEYHKMRPMLLDKTNGELYVCTRDYKNYVGIARPGDDALQLVARVADTDKFREWLKRNGITELIVPGGDR